MTFDEETGVDHMTFDEETGVDHMTFDREEIKKEEAKAIRTAILDLVCEEIYKPFFRRHEEFVRITNRNYLLLVVLQLILIAILLMSWLW